MALGLGLTSASVGCSVTEETDSGYQSPVVANDLSLTLDLAQYEAGAGPCLTAASEGGVRRVNMLVEGARYAHFASVAARHGVRSSLSLPLVGAQQPAALNFYAATASAFDEPRPRQVADLLARCVTVLLQRGPADHPVPVAELDEALARRGRIRRAEDTLAAGRPLSRADAFAELVRRSRVESRSIHDVAGDLCEPGTTP
ncbi:MAG TPA: ANTAR domain-containing protein [Mycobacteriales bacterium]|nr:ANTAR domain-containing protein [Mycobacteriales bacterium]